MRQRHRTVAEAFVAVVAVVGGFTVGNALHDRPHRAHVPAVTVRSLDLVADTVARHGALLATLTVCSDRTVRTLESLTWIGGDLPQTIYADAPRTWPPGCTPLPLRVAAEAEPRPYRLQVTETPLRPEGGSGVVVWATSPPFRVT